MKKIMSVLALVMLFVGSSVSAQTSKEIVGQWRLVSGTDVSGKALDVKAMHKSENVFNVFKESGTYMHVSGSKVDTGSWAYADATKTLTVNVDGKTNVYKFTSFGGDKSTVTGSGGTMNFVKY